MLELSEATFLYAPNRGIANVSLKIDVGEVLGVVGANGAGKSTLLGLASAALLPQSGSVRLSLADTRGRGRVRRYDSDSGIGYRLHTGYLTERAPVCEEMKVQGYLRYRAILRGERLLRIRRRVNDAIVRCGLEAVRRTRLSQLSPGMQRRVAVAEALLTQPEVLILDDPFAGMDLAFRDAFVGMIKQAAQRSHVLIGGHDLELMSQCCTRFVLVENGRIADDHLSFEDACATLRLQYQQTGGTK